MSTSLDFLYAEAAHSLEGGSPRNGSPSQQFLSPASSASSFSVNSVPEMYNKTWSPGGSRRSFALNSFNTPRKLSSKLLATGNVENNWAAANQVAKMLKHYIIHRCTLNEFCCEHDFDATALDALFKMPFLQAMQTVEHFSSSVSARIQKKSAYLMGILRGQEAHWDKYLSNIGGHFRARQVLDLPPQFLLYIGNCCLSAHCLPSDFTPEVVLSLHALDFSLAVKSVSAFNTNKRIIAGHKGGVINRPRFFLRLIQNVADQAQDERLSVPELRGLARTQSGGSSRTSTTTEGDHCEGLIEGEPKHLSSELNLEQLADLNFNGERRADTQRLLQLQEELKRRDLREHRMIQELQMTRQHLMKLQSECMGLRKLLNAQQHF